MAELIDVTAEPTTGFRSPRAWAFTILGLCALPKFMLPEGDQIVETLAMRLMDLYRRVSKPDWVWLEESLSYDNARLPESLIAAGARLNDPGMIEMGTRSLAWLNRQQVDDHGNFSPVGSDFQWHYGSEKPVFDQQPVEAWASVDANLTALKLATGDDWKNYAELAYHWFCGNNILRAPVRDVMTGGCFDGLQRDGMNANQGAESTLSYLLAAESISALALESPAAVLPPARLQAVGRGASEDKKVA